MWLLPSEELQLPMHCGMCTDAEEDCRLQLAAGWRMLELKQP